MSHIATSGSPVWERELNGATIQQMPEQVASDDGTVLIRLMYLENPVVIAT